MPQDVVSAMSPQNRLRLLRELHGLLITKEGGKALLGPFTDDGLQQFLAKHDQAGPVFYHRMFLVPKRVKKGAKPKYRFIFDGTKNPQRFSRLCD